MIRLRATLIVASVVAAIAPAVQARRAVATPRMIMPMSPETPPDQPPAKHKHTAKAASAAKKKSPAPKRAATSGSQSIDHQTMPGMDHSAMPGMGMPSDEKRQSPHADTSAMPETASDRSGEAGSRGMQSMPGMEMPGNAGGTAAASMENAQPTGTALAAGDAPAPAVPNDHAADRVYPHDEMAMARQHLQIHHGGQGFHQALLNVAEGQFREGVDAYRWAGQAWFGSDVNRMFVKSEGEGTFHDGLGSAEVQALYSRAIGPYFNLQAGARQDLGPSPKRTYAAVGFEGLAPEFVEVEGAVFLSNKGDVLARLEGYYDQRVTQRLILQPRVELNFAAQDVPENRIGSGLSDAEVGLRLRYELRREFAPYIGVSWERSFGDTARFVRSDGGRATSRSVVAGIRTWF